MGLMFRYRSKDTNGKDKDGAIEATDDKDAVKKLQEQGLFVISVDKIENKENVCPKCGKGYDSSWKVCLSCNVPLTQGESTTAEKTLSHSPIYKKRICPYCGSPNVGRTRGVHGAEVFIAIILYVLLIIPGFIYYIYMETVPYCSDCGRRVWKK